MDRGPTIEPPWPSWGGLGLLGFRGLGVWGFGGFRGFGVWGFRGLGFSGFLGFGAQGAFAVCLGQGNCSNVPHESRWGRQYDAKKEHIFS